MRATVLAFVLLGCLATDVFAQSVYVKPYFRKNGAYVQGYYRTSPDRSFYNNWSSYPNMNPFTGRTGTRLYRPYGSSYSSSYRSSYRRPSYRSYGGYGSYGALQPLQPLQPFRSFGSDW